MKNISKLIFTLIFNFGLLLILALPAQAGFGVSPGTIMNDLLRPGSHFEQNIHLSRSDPQEDLDVIIEPDLGQLSSWFKFEPGLKFTFPKGKNEIVVKAVIDVPRDAPYSQYKGVIRIKATNKDNDVGGVSVIKGARMEVSLVTTQIEVPQLTVRSISFPNDTATAGKDGQSELIAKITIENSGNVEIAPSRVGLNITSLLNESLMDLDNYNRLDSIPANQTKDIEAKFKVKIASGEYFGNVTVFLKDKTLRSERLVFKILGASTIDTTSSSLAINKLSLSTLILILMIIIIVISLIWFYFIFFRLLLRRRHLSRRQKLISLVILLSLFASLSAAFINSRSKSEADNSGAVKGVSVQLTPAPSSPPTLLPESSSQFTVKETSPDYYYIYSEPDNKSIVVYVAQDGEKLTVIDENSAWYRVQYNDQDSGWLSKSSIKAVEY